MKCCVCLSHAFIKNVNQDADTAAVLLCEKSINNRRFFCSSVLLLHYAWGTRFSMLDWVRVAGLLCTKEV